MNEKKIFRKIKEERMKKGITVRELAEKTKISPANISNIENGKQNPGIKILIKIVKALKLNIEIKKLE